MYGRSLICLVGMCILFEWYVSSLNGRYVYLVCMVCISSLNGRYVLLVYMVGMYM